jgi:hypothetical protein
MAKLAYDEVKRRVLEASSEVIDDLSQLGDNLVKDGIDRIEKSNGQARALAAYSGGIVTLAMSTLPLWESRLLMVFKIVAVIGVFGLLLAAWIAIKAAFPVDTEWYSDSDWLQSDLLQNKEQIRRYRVLTTWNIVHSFDRANETKQKKLSRANMTMQISLALLLASFFQIAWRLAAFQSLRIWVR